MKIGILTFHRAINYGAVLQCYALSESLKELGHDVWIVDYRPDYLEKKRIPLYFSLGEGGWIVKLKKIIATLIMFYSRKSVIYKFDSFLKNNIKLTSSFSKIENAVLTEFDVLVFGSDQIWSPSICNGFDDVYWGNFSHEGIKLITYAASMGGHNKLCHTERNEIKKLLRSYNNISVREIALKNLVIELGAPNVSLVCDPTFIPKREIFDVLAKRPNVDDYVLFFSLEEDREQLKYAHRIAQMYNKKLVWLQTYKGLRRFRNVCVMGSVSIPEFLGLFKYASHCVCVSFHATAFSIIFHKDFYVLETTQADRARNLLEEVGLSERLINKTDDIPISPINYDFVDSRLKDMVSKSKKYLVDSLDEK